MRNRILWMVCLQLALLCFLAGCAVHEDTESDSGGFCLYFISSTGDSYEKVPYELKNKDDTLAAVTEIIHELSDSEQFNTDQYKAALQGVGLDSVEFDEGNVTIDFEEGYSKLSSLNEGMIRTAIVKSVLQLDKVESVTFSVNGASLLDQEGAPVGPMNDQSFILEDDEEDVYSGQQDVVLYYANEEGTQLIPYHTKINSKDNEPFEKIVIESLLKEPSAQDSQSEEKMISPLNEDLKVNQTQVLNNICYVDLNEEIENLVPGVKEEVTIYAMVDSLASINPIYQIQFTVNGEKRSTLNNVKNFDSLFSANLVLVTKPAKK